MTSDKSNFISPAQCRAARALLGWSQGDLAASASVAVSTVADFERGHRSPVANNLDAIFQAFERADIRFTSGGAVVGVAPRQNLTSLVPAPQLKPVRWVDEIALDAWARQINARRQLPELIRRLLIARHGPQAEIRFPSGDHVQLHGWDGLTRLKSTDPHIPNGSAAWEMGADANPRKKASDDYAKRSADPGAVKPSDTTFVFVTPRGWGTKEEWIVARRAENIWRDVRVIDGVDLVQLLEQTPAVALWLAQQTNRVPQNVRLLEDAWREWSLSTAVPLSEALILSGRDKDAAVVHRWLNGNAASIAIQGESTAEAIAFLRAAISLYPSQQRDAILSRVVVAASEEVTRDFANVAIPLIIVAGEMDPGVAANLVGKGHHVYLAYGSGISAPTNTVVLARPSRFAIEDELKELKLGDQKAEKLARDCGGSLTALRRLMEAAPGQQIPIWARSDQSRHYLPLLLAGAWNDRNEADRKAISKLGGIPYSDLVKNLTAGLLLPESPVRFVGSIWKIASPRDAWLRLAAYLTPDDFKKFKSIAFEVLSEQDPVFEQEDENWLSSPDKFSTFLKQGLLEAAILMGVFSRDHYAANELSAMSDGLVRSLLHGADTGRWWSLARYLPDLAEVSPVEFLKAVEDSLEKNDPAVLILFQEREGGIFSKAYHAPLLWALEMLAWSPEHLGRVTSILLKLVEITPPTRWTNRPSNSLLEIYRLWHPQTYVCQEDRLDILEESREDYSQAMWQLSLGLYPKGYDTTGNTPKPRWRTFDEPSQAETVTHQSVWAAAARISDWLLRDVGLSPQRWHDIIQRFSDFSPDLRKKFAELARALPEKLVAEADRELVRVTLRAFIYHHRQFKYAGWALPEEELTVFHEIHDNLESSDPLDKFSWLFVSGRAALLNPPGADWQENEKVSRAARDSAMREIFNEYGSTCIAKLLKKGASPDLIGQALADAAEDETINRILGELFVEEDEYGLSAAGRLTFYMGFKQGDEWGQSLIGRGLEENWPLRSLGIILAELPQTETLHQRIKLLSPKLQDEFWQRISPYTLDVRGDEQAWVLEGLLSHERAYEAAELVIGQGVRIKSGTIVGILDGILETQDRLSTTMNDSTMLQYYVEQLFLRLDEDEKFNQEELGRLEWAYLKMLEYSSRPPRTLHHRLASNPTFFCEVVSAIFRSQEDQNEEELTEEDRKQQEFIAGNAFTLLNSWREMPGIVDEAVQYEALKQWVTEARRLCEKAGRKQISDQKIGEILAYSPVEADGSWPCLPVRKLIEFLKSEDVDTGFRIGTINKRGVTSRGVFDGGELERKEAAYYRSHAKAARPKWSRTASILESLAKMYEVEATDSDQDAERRQWR